MVAVDDGSSDDTLARLRNFGDRIAVLTGPNRGACAARNRGWTHAKEMGASHALFLDADDYLEGPFLDGLSEVAGRTGADLVLGNMHLEYPGEGGGAPVREERFLYGDGTDGAPVAPEAFLIGWMAGDYVNPSGLLWSGDLLETVGGWDESLARNQDLDITLRALLRRPRVAKSERGAAIHARVNRRSISNTASERARRSRLRAQSGILARIGGTEFAPAAPHFEREIYAIARDAFRDGLDQLGREALAVLDRHGMRRHFGSPAHVTLSHLLGLERKAKLVRALKLGRRTRSNWERWSERAGRA